MTAHILDHKRLSTVARLRFSSDRVFNQLIAESYDVGGSQTGQGTANPYAMQPDTLHFLRELLRRVKPAQIMEFGSGESTRLFAEWAQTCDARMISFEHDGYWAGEVQSSLSPSQRQHATIVHAHLALERHGLRLFLTYKGLPGWSDEARKSTLFLLDGPHLAGREPVLYFVLNNCPVGGIVIIDDFSLYAVSDMLATVPRQLAESFDGTAIEGNSHGLYVLRRRQPHAPSKIPLVGAKAVLRSYWRCLRDFRIYGTGKLNK
jgi:hypothetical protein